MSQGCEECSYFGDKISNNSLVGKETVFDYSPWNHFFKNMTHYTINWESFLTFTFAILLIGTIAEGLKGFIMMLGISIALLIVAAITTYFDNKKMK